MLEHEVIELICWCLIIVIGIFITETGALDTIDNRHESINQGLSQKVNMSLIFWWHIWINIGYSQATSLYEALHCSCEVWLEVSFSHETEVTYGNDCNCLHFCVELGVL